MSGLNLGISVGAQARPAGTTTGGGSYPSPSTAAEAGFGPGFTQPGMPGRKGALMPNDPFGVALWSGVAALGLLLLIRYSLPN